MPFIFAEFVLCWTGDEQAIHFQSPAANQGPHLYIVNVKLCELSNSLWNGLQSGKVRFIVHCGLPLPWDYKRHRHESWKLPILLFPPALLGSLLDWKAITRSLHLAMAMSVDGCANKLLPGDWSPMLTSGRSLRWVQLAATPCADIILMRAVSSCHCQRRAWHHRVKQDQKTSISRRLRRMRDPTCHSNTFEKGNKRRKRLIPAALNSCVVLIRMNVKVKKWTHSKNWWCSWKHLLADSSHSPVFEVLIHWARWHCL